MKVETPMCGAPVVSCERSSQVHLPLLWSCFAALDPRRVLLRVEKEVEFHIPSLLVASHIQTKDIRPFRRNVCYAISQPTQRVQLLLR